MKLTLVSLNVAFALGVRLLAADDPTVIYVPHEQVEKRGTLATGDVYRISVNTREGQPQSEMHEKEIDTIYVLSGRATMVTGGQGIEMKNTRPGQWLGTAIQGGNRQVLSKGDVIVIPPGVNHWVTDITESPLVYYIVKVVQP